MCCSRVQMVYMVITKWSKLEKVDRKRLCMKEPDLRLICHSWCQCLSAKVNLLWLLCVLMRTYVLHVYSLGCYSVFCALTLGLDITSNIEAVNIITLIIIRNFAGIYWGI